MSDYPKCPNCGSSNTDLSKNTQEKVGWANIGEFAIGFGAGMLGLGDYVQDVNLTNNINAELKCNNCGYVWPYDEINAAVTKVWIDKDVEIDCKIGVLIHANFEVNGMLNKQGVCQAFFYDVDGRSLNDTNDQFCSEDGSVTCCDYFQPQYENTIYNDFKLFIPYEELHLNHPSIIKCDVYISDGNYWLAKSSQVEFECNYSQHKDVDVENEYISVLKECLSDGAISESERRLLDKLRDKLGVSVYRAKELEDAFVKPMLSSEETEYLEEYKAVSKDGQVSENERRLLDKLRVVLGLSHERAKELEEKASKATTSNKERLMIRSNNSEEEWIPNNNMASPL